MARATVDEVFQIMQASSPNGSERVQRSPRNAIRDPEPGHIYFTPGRPTDRQMAMTSNRAGPAEASLLKMNDAHMVKIGVRNFATANIFNPPRDGIETEQAIVAFQWINHTHPLDMATEAEMVIRGPTRADREALRQLRQRWGQRRSYIIVCRGGRVLQRVEFELGLSREEMLRALHD